MNDVDEHGRREPPLAATEIEMLRGFLNYQRSTLAWKCTGVAHSDMQVSVGASTMTLGGLLKHLSYVEDEWSARWVHGMERREPWDTVDWKTDPDWDWNSAQDDVPDDLLLFWRRSVERSQRLLDDALADGGLDRLAVRTWPDGRVPSLRWVLLHLIEEYSRHNGHADLLREVIDGATGE